MQGIKTYVEGCKGILCRFENDFLKIQWRYD